MENWRKDARREPVITGLDGLVSKDHLLRKIEKVMDYEWLYERLEPYYCHDNGRPGTDPVVLIKMVLIQDAVYDKVTSRYDVEFETMDAGFKTPWIAKNTLDDGKIPILPYTRYNGKKDQYKPWEYNYDPVNDTYICPQGESLRHTTTDRNGKRTYRSTPASCKNCPCRVRCGANEKGQKVLHSHIWQEYLDIVEQLRKTERGKEIYALRKETIERVFADAKEKHAMRYTHHRSLAAVTRWVRLKYAAMNLKKMAVWSWYNSFFRSFLAVFFPLYADSRGFS